jgi:hypothetical protein
MSTSQTSPKKTRTKRQGAGDGSCNANCDCLKSFAKLVADIQKPCPDIDLSSLPVVDMDFGYDKNGGKKTTDETSTNNREDV